MPCCHASSRARLGEKKGLYAGNMVSFSRCKTPFVHKDISVQVEWISGKTDLTNRNPTRPTSYAFTASLLVILLPHLFVFIAHGMLPLVISTCVCLALTVVSFVLIHKAPDFRYIVVNTAQTIIFMLSMVAFLGTACGAHLYCFAIITTAMFLRQIAGEKAKILMPVRFAAALFTLYFIISSLWFMDHAPMCSFSDSLTLKVIFSLNALASIISVVTLTGIYLVSSVTVSDRLSSEAHHDELTGLLNRRGFYPHLDEAYEQSLGGKGICYLAMLDIDHFKLINDEHGHEVGDIALCAIADLAREYMKKHEGLRIARWGGEEFLLIYNLAKDVFSSEDAKNESVMDVQNAHNIAFNFFEGIREDVSRLAIDPDGVNLALSVTIGVADFAECEALDAAIALADKRLYEGKESGRNRVVFSLVAS